MNNRLIGLLAVFLATPSLAETDPISLAVIIDSSSPLEVEYIGGDYVKNVKVSALAGLVGGVIHAGSIANTNKEFETRLRASVGSTDALGESLRTSLAEAFEEQTTDIVLEFFAADRLKKGKPDFSQFDASTNSHIVVIKESTGLSTPAGNLGALTPQSTLTIQVFNTKSRKRILKEKIQGIGPQTTDIDAALDSKDFYLDGYTQAGKMLGFNFFWRLNGRNMLHEVAKDTPHAADFPSIEGLMKDYAKRFDFDRPKPRGWRKPRTGSPFVFRAEPKKDKAQFAIVTDIDLLLKELGQEFHDLDSYLDMRIGRLADLGFPTSEIAEVPVLSFGDEWVAYSVPEPRGGTAVFVHKKLNEYVITHQIVILGDDPVPLLEKYKVDTERYVAEALLTFDTH